MSTALQERAPASATEAAHRIAELTLQNRVAPRVETERELLVARLEAFRARGPAPPRERAPLRADPVPLDAAVGLPVAHGRPSASLVRSAIEEHGSILVRGLLGPKRAEELRRAVEAALAARDAAATGAPSDPAWYSEFPLIAGDDCRSFTAPDGVLAADSPRGHFFMLEALEEHGVMDVATGFLGERPALSVEKTVLRCVRPQLFAPWHQDGAFLGESITTLDVWIALTPCGRTSPGLEVFPRRMKGVLPTGGVFAWDLSDEVLTREYPGVRPVTPELEAGDALLFDQLCVHRSGHQAGMTGTRLALECWLFSPASVPAEYTGLGL